jgi:hypothetical protein
MAVQKPPCDVSHRSPNCGGYAAARKVEAFAVHCTDGTNSLGWLTSPASQASANYLVRKDGYIYELVPPNISPWTNGDVQRPDLGNPLIAAWVKAGTNPNTRTLTCEMECKSTYWAPGALTDKQEESLVALIAWGLDSHGLPVNDTRVIRHSQINDVTRHNCPGFSPAEFASYIARAAALVSGGHPQPTPPPGPTPPYARSFIDANGCAVTEINYGGVATSVDGYVIQDAGISVVGGGGAIYDRSVTPAGFSPWTKRP